MSFFINKLALKLICFFENGKAKMNFLIHDTDTSYKFGLVEYIKDFFNGSNNVSMERQCAFAYSHFQKYDLSETDIIIFPIKKGEQFTCFPELCSQFKTKIIVITDKPVENKNALPWCFSEAFFICREDSINSVGVMLKNIIKGTINTVQAKREVAKRCLNCKKKNLTEQQSSVISLFYTGFNVFDISRMLEVDVKTVYSHKRCAMQAFNLHTDFELFEFITSRAQKYCNTFIT